MLSDTVKTLQSMPIKIEIESVDGRFSKEISAKTCQQKVTGNYRVVNWNDHQNIWLHLTQCNFPKPANDGLVDLLVDIDNAELHYSHVDSVEKMVDLSPDSDHLGGAVLVRLLGRNYSKIFLTSFPVSVEILLVSLAT